MEIDIKTVDRVAALANLRFSDEEKERIRQDMGKIVTYFEKMNELTVVKDMSFGQAAADRATVEQKQPAPTIPASSVPRRRRDFPPSKSSRAKFNSHFCAAEIRKFIDVRF